jgi:uncharacterized membrane protein YciS (DUF1049 family)
VLVGGIVIFVVGMLLGAAITSVLYERNMIKVNRRAENVRRISQLDVFELPESLKSVPPPARKSPPPLPTQPEKK